LKWKTDNIEGMLEIRIANKRENETERRKEREENKGT
jgi:hypothetical protein